MYGKNIIKFQSSMRKSANCSPETKRNNSIDATFYRQSNFNTSTIEPESQNSKTPTMNY